MVTHSSKCFWHNVSQPPMLSRRAGRTPSALQIHRKERIIYLFDLTWLILVCVSPIYLSSFQPFDVSDYWLLHVVVAAAIADRQSVDSTDEKSSGMFCPWGWSCLASKMSLYPNSFKLLLLLLLLVFLNFQAMCCGNKKENITSEATRFSFSSRTNDYTAGNLLSAEEIPATFLHQFFDLGVKTITKKQPSKSTNR